MLQQKIAPIFNKLLTYSACQQRAMLFVYSVERRHLNYDDSDVDGDGDVGRETEEEYKI